MFRAASRFRNGVNNLFDKHALANLPVPSLVEYGVVVQDHFDKFNASDWTVEGVGTPARAIFTTDPNGVLGLTTSGVANDTNAIFTQSPCWRTTRATVDTAPATLYFATRFKCTEATNSRVAGGFTTAATSAALFPTTLNGIIFEKAAGGTTLNLVIGNGTTATTTAILTTFAANTYYNVAFTVEKGEVNVFVNGTRVKTITGVTTFPSTTANLYAGTGVLTSAAAAISHYVDTFLAAGDAI